MSYDTAYSGRLYITAEPLTIDERTYIEATFNDDFYDYFTCSSDGAAITCDGVLDSFDYLELVEQLVRFLLGGSLDTCYAPFAGQRATHVINGTITAEGEDAGDGWRIEVSDGEIADTMPR